MTNTWYVQGMDKNVRGVATSTAVHFHSSSVRPMKSLTTPLHGGKHSAKCVKYSTGLLIGKLSFRGGNKSSKRVKILQKVFEMTKHFFFY